MKLTRSHFLVAGIGLVFAGSLLGVYWHTNPSHAMQRAAEKPLPRPIDFDAIGKNRLSGNESKRQPDELARWADALDLAGMAGMLDATNSIADKLWRKEVRSALLASWARRDLPGVMDWFGRRNSADALHEQARDELAGSMAANDPHGHLSWMEQALPDSVGQEICGAFFRAWAVRDPAGAAAGLQQLGPHAGAMSGDLIGQVASVWAGQNVDGALSWAQSLPDNGARSLAMAQICSRWVTIDPRAAATYAAQTANAPMIQVVAGHWAEAAPISAASWAQSLPEGDARSSALATVASVWASTDPAAAAAYAAGVEPDDAQARAVLAVVTAWSDSSPAEAAQWVAAFPESGLRGQAMAQVVIAWAGQDSSAATRWIQTLPPGDSRDAAVGAFSGVVAQSNPSSAFNWASTISRPGSAQPAIGEYRADLAGPGPGCRTTTDCGIQPSSANQDAVDISRQSLIAFQMMFDQSSISTLASESHDSTPLYRDPAQPIDARVADLLSRMTIQEKADQICQSVIQDFNPNNIQTTGNQKVKPTYGSYICAVNVPTRNWVQKVAMEESRLGIPAVFGADVIHGCFLTFPIPLAQACSWDPGLVRRACGFAASEARRAGVDWVFAPMIDVTFDPRWGRIAKGYGESPCTRPRFSPLRR